MIFAIIREKEVIESVAFDLANYIGRGNLNLHVKVGQGLSSDVALALAEIFKQRNWPHGWDMSTNRFLVGAAIIIMEEV